MAALSALAMVAQDCIPAHAQEAAQKAILQADLERTRLDYERSRMLAEDNHMKCRNETLGAIRTLGVHQRALQAARDEAEENDIEIEEMTSNIDNLEDIIESLHQQMGETPFEQRCFLEHTQPSDTEANDRKKFTRLFK